MKARKSGEKGFTLIELLVVIAILGTLAAVVTLNVTQFIGKGCDEAKATELHNVQTAVAAYMYDNSGSVPANTAAMVPTFLMTTPHGTYTYNSAGTATQATYSCSH